MRDGGWQSQLAVGPVCGFCHGEQRSAHLLCLPVYVPGAAWGFGSVKRPASEGRLSLKGSLPVGSPDISINI